MPVAIWAIVMGLGIEEAAIAAVGVAIVAAMVPLGVLAGNWARQLPPPLSSLAQGMVAATEAAIRLSVAWTQASAQGLATVIQAPWQAIWTVARGGVVAAEHTYWAVWTLYHLSIPNVQTYAYQVAMSAQLAAERLAQQLALAVADYAQRLVAEAEQRADQEVQQAVRHADQVGQAVAGYAQALVAGAMARADLEVLQAEQRAQAQAQAVAGYAQALTAEAIGYGQRAGVQAEDYARGLAADAEGYARALADAVRADARADADSVARSAAAATAAVAEAVRTIEDSPCQRYCSPLGDLGSLLQGLEDAGLTALLLAVVEEAEHDPGAVAGALREVFQPIARGALGGLAA